jgi:acetoin utilization deacetylase AcuC-like enzyme
MAKTGVVTDPLYIKHDPGMGHPESPDRLRAIYSLIEKEGILKKCTTVAPRPATEEELCRVHASEYYKRIAECDGRSVMLDPDTATSPDSFKAAELAAGGCLTLTEQVVGGEVECGYALIRPPGHHAERGRAMGFCIFNNVAVAAEHALLKQNCKKVLIADWDLHHGNGTMHSFYDRKDVLYFSTHQYPYYPGTGALQDVGSGDGEGFTVNVPLGYGMGDVEFRAIFRRILAPVAAQYAPDLILVSTGFDTYYADPLGGMKMTAEGYGMLTAELLEMAGGSAGGRLILMLEGGYNLEGLSQGVGYCLKAMLSEWSPETASGDDGKAGPIIDAVMKVQSRFWKF